MGRELRQVPADWVHPKTPNDSRYIPLLAGSYDEDWEDFYAQHVLWLKGQHPSQLDERTRERVLEYRWYHEYTEFPVRERWRFMEYHIAGRECTHWQLYESTTEGTPTSPVFETAEDLFAWMKHKGYSAQAIAEITRSGSCPAAWGWS